MKRKLIALIIIAIILASSTPAAAQIGPIEWMCE